jgi:predicted AAA+ superfamily ATPase
MLTNQLGRPVSGEDFFDREDKLNQIWQLLHDSNNLLLLAPRRVGKTSLMTRLGAQAARIPGSLRQCG